MLELIVNYLNQSLAVLGYWERITCLAEIKEDEKGIRQPIAYIGQGQWSAIDFDNADGWGYFRLRGEITSSDVVGVATLRKRVTKSFPLRFVFAVRRSKLSADDAFAFARIAQTVEAAITNDYGPLVAQIGAARVTVRVTSQNGDALAVWTDETAGTGTLEPRYELVYGAIDIEVSVTADIACFALECDDVDLDLLHTFDFCLPTVRERLTPEQIECLTDALCETPPTLCEQLGDVAPEDVVADVFDCLTPEAQDELISEVCPPCDPLTITFNGETITTIDEPCGETVALTCSTMTASAYVEDGHPVTGAYHPDGTVNGKTKYTKDGTHYLFYNGTAWELEKQGANETATAGNQNFPWLATWPTITVTQANIGEACCECASGEVVVTNSDGDPIATIDVPSGVTVPYEIPDVDWTDSDGSPQSTPYGDAIVCSPCVPINCNAYNRLPSKTWLWCYADRGLISGYTGNLLQFRKATGGATFNVPQDANGYNDVAFVVANRGADAATLPIVYDQAGTGVNLLQGTVGSQPRYAVGSANDFGHINIFSPANVGQMNASQSLALNSTVTVYIVVMPLSTAGAMIASSSTGWWLEYSGTNSFYMYDGAIYPASANALQPFVFQLITVQLKQNALIVRINGVQVLSSATWNRAATTSFTVGSRVGGSNPSTQGWRACLAHSGDLDTAVESALISAYDL